MVEALLTGLAQVVAWPAIGLMLVVVAIRARFFGAPVYRVEEELGLGEGIQLADSEASSA